VSTNSAVNPNAVGVYAITYTATDPSGNTATNTRTVYVVDRTVPVITFYGSNPLTNECHTAFADPGATASDTCAGSVAVSTNSTVNPNAVGVYAVTYMATDPSGNTATNTRTVYVVDTTPPVLVCATNKSAECGSAWSFDPPEASDGCSGTNVTVSIVGTVTNGSCPAVITRTWLAVDAGGNSNRCSQVVTLAALPTVRFDPPEWLANGGLRLTLLGTITGSVTVQWAQDVTNAPDTNWVGLAHFTNFTGSAQYIDYEATNFPRRFYRAITP